MWELNITKEDNYLICKDGAEWQPLLRLNAPKSTFIVRAVVNWTQSQSLVVTN